MYRLTKFCRLCLNKEIKIAFKLSKIPLGEKYFLNKNKALKQKKFPQTIGWCPKCNNVQVMEVINNKLLWQNYTYLSGQTEAIVKHFEKFTKKTLKRFNLNKNDLIIDIGSNDGSLLKAFKKSKKKIRVLGVEPAKNVAQLAEKKNINTLNKFFDFNLSKLINKKFKKAKIITCFNTFAHSENLRSIVKGIKNILDKDGVFIFECQYLMDIYKNKILGTFFHEHLYHHSVSSLKYFFNLYGMELFDVEKANIQKGSIIGYVGFKKRFEIKKNVKNSIKKENFRGNRNLKYLKKFEKFVRVKKEECKKILSNKKLNVTGFGSARSGPTLAFNYGINDKIKAIFDDHPLKRNKFTGLNGLPVYPTKMINSFNNNVSVILAYLHSKKIIRKNLKYLKGGGKFLIIYPNPKLIHNKNYKKFI